MIARRTDQYGQRRTVGEVDDAQLLEVLERFQLPENFYYPYDWRGASLNERERT